MDWSIVASSFVLGLIASLSCLGLCIPILVPYIMEKDKTPKEGLFTSIFFSIGRLIIYFALGVAVFIIGSTLTEEAPENWLKVAVAILGCVVIVYGLWIVFKLPKPKWCPARLTRNFRPLFSVLLGVLIGSFFCPLLWIALVRATLSQNALTLSLSVISFWAGSSFSILAAGTVSGEVGGRWGKKIGIEKLRDLCGMALILVGVFYLINGLVL
ncbi:MAG: sulfite exporter TauE/SafE family protein [Methanomassiliicoccales archaeon]|nr:MAG: sulfite exporter TauE/SafE family protein [Methanomassiliicoccales archaeon]